MPEARTFESARRHFRARAYFDVRLRDEPPGTIEYIMRHRNKPFVVTSYPWGLERINVLSACRTAAPHATAAAHTLGPILYQCLFNNTPITRADIERTADAFLAAFAT